MQGIQKKVHMVAIALLIIGGLNYGVTGIFKVDLITRFLGKNTFSARALCILYGLAALSLMFHRDTYLPFLGEAVMPCSLLQNRIPPGGTYDMAVTVAPHAKVLYWAAEPASEHLKEINDWSKAYLDFENAGVTTADSHGVATLTVRKPQAYSVSMKGHLDPHIHYRVCGNRGMVGRIQTVFLK